MFFPDVREQGVALWGCIGFAVVGVVATAWWLFQGVAWLVVTISRGMAAS